MIFHIRDLCNFSSKHNSDRGLHGNKDRLDKLFGVLPRVTSEICFTGSCQGPISPCPMKQWVIRLRRLAKTACFLQYSCLRSPIPTAIAPRFLGTSVIAYRPTVYKFVRFLLNLPLQSHFVLLLSLLSY